MKIGLKIAVLFVFISLLPIAQGAEFTAWSSWEYSNTNIIKVEENALKINMKNESLSMSAVLNLTRGEKFSVFLEYTTGEYVTMAGYRVFLNGEQVGEGEMEKSGGYFINITVSEDSSYEITLYFFVIQGTLNITLSRGKIVAVPNDWTAGLYLSGIGITTVFGVLGLLSIVMYGMKGIKEEAKEEVEDMKIAEEGPTPEEIIAITAAIDSYMHGKKFKIISVKPSPWKYYGRMSIMRRLK